MAGTQERRAEVLRAIVTDYITSREPVGSRSLVERHKLGVSSATIRNDMGVLEAEGYITQQHASSGRIPTEKGYRAFVDTIHDIKPLSRAEHRAILSFLQDGVDLEDVLRRSVHLLAQLTRQVAVVQVPTLTVSHVKHCEIVQLTPHRLLLVLITDTGRVEQRNVEVTSEIPTDDVPRVRDAVNRALSGKTLAEAPDAMESLVAHAPRELRSVIVACATVIVETLVERPSDRLILAGASNLTRTQEGSNALRPVLEALEEQVVVLKLLAVARDLESVHVSIGEENETEELRGASIVSAGYGGVAERLGGLGVVGPTFMDYPGTMSHVAVVAKYVGDVLRGE